MNLEQRKRVPIVAANTSIRLMIAIRCWMGNKVMITFKIDLRSSSDSQDLSRSSEDVTSIYS